MTDGSVSAAFADLQARFGHVGGEELTLGQREFRGVLMMGQALGFPGQADWVGLITGTAEALCMEDDELVTACLETVAVAMAA